MTARAQKLIASLIQQLEPILQANCFHPAGDWSRDTYHREVQWLRRWGWKTDRIRLINKVGNVNVYTEVLLPPMPDTTIDADTIDQFILSTYLTGSSKPMRLPLLQWRDQALIERITGNFDVLLAWLREFDSPEQCRRRMHASPHFIHTSPAFMHNDEYLRTMAEVIHSSGCLLQVHGTFPSAYSRAHFDVHHRGLLPPCETQ